MLNIHTYKSENVQDLSIRLINTAFRAADESHLWPVNGRLNATERAIRRLRKFRKATDSCNGDYEYALALEREISNIVNNI